MPPLILPLVPNSAVKSSIQSDKEASRNQRQLEAIWDWARPLWCSALEASELKAGMSNAAAAVDSTGNGSTTTWKAGVANLSTRRPLQPMPLAMTYSARPAIAALYECRVRNAPGHPSNADGEAPERCRVELDVTATPRTLCGSC